MYYLAYGSNLNLGQMKTRCPDFKVLGTYMLKDYVLQFRQYLTVKKEKGGVVPIGVFEVSNRDVVALDRYEGVKDELYFKEEMEIEFNGKKIKALIYIENEELRQVEVPDNYYFNKCLVGYRDFGFDEKYLYEAYERAKRGL